MSVAFCCPSYKRPGQVRTVEYVPWLRVYVDGIEADEYRMNNPGVDIVACPDGVQGNVSRVRNYIMREEFAAGHEGVVLLDDDMRNIAYWDGEPRTDRHELPTEYLREWVDHNMRVAHEWGAYMWGVNLMPDPQAYNITCPFTVTRPVLGPFQAFRAGSGCWYDERLYLKEDYDMFIQQMNRHRKVLRLNRYFYQCKQSENIGGCATQRNMRREKEQLELLQRKWGRQIVRNDGHKDRSHRAKKSRVSTIDYNPVIRVPISGV
ncbi:MAG: hypothetical protein QM346_12175 [Chloroflexota bacterium]|nr:hypothetical protein [Chloroflexota bacterium]